MIFGRQYCAGWYNLFENALMILLMTTWLVASDQSHSQQREEVGLSPPCARRSQWWWWWWARKEAHWPVLTLNSSSNMSYWHTIANRGSVTEPLPGWKVVFVISLGALAACYKQGRPDLCLLHPTSRQTTMLLATTSATHWMTLSLDSLGKE